MARYKNPEQDNIDRSKTLVGQTLHHSPYYGTAVDFDFHCNRIRFDANYGKPPTVHCYGHRIKKDGTVGVQSGECELFLKDVPAVDLVDLLRIQRRDVQREVKAHLTNIESLKIVLAAHHNIIDQHAIDEYLALAAAVEVQW